MTDGNEDEIYDQAALIKFLPNEYKLSNPLFDENSKIGLLIPHNDGRKISKMKYFLNETDDNKPIKTT